MRLTGRILGMIVGLIAATLCASGCRSAPEPYTPAGADTPWQPEPLPNLFRDAATVVTDIAIENQADATVVVVRTSGASPQVRAHQRYEPTPHVALDIQAARLGTTSQPLAPHDPGGILAQVVTVERIRNMQPQVVIRVHLHEAVPFEVEQDDGVIRLALAHRQADAGESAAPEAPAAEPSVSEAAEPTTREEATEPVAPDAVAEFPEAETIPEPPPVEPDAAPAEPLLSETAAEPPAAETVTESATNEAAVEPASSEPVAERPQAGTASEPPSEAAAASDEPPVYSGEGISLDVQEADIHDVLRLIADVVGINVIAGTNVQGNVTTRLENVPWDEALDAVLSINGLGYERSGNVIRIAPLEHFVKERETRLREQEARQQIQPIFTRVITINYANAAALQPNLEKLLSDRGSLAVDTRTNTIIVNDTQAAISTIADLVATLDRVTPRS
jgi:hypothetical protein